MDYANEKESEIQSLNKQITDMKKVIERLREEKNSLATQALSRSPGASQHFQELIADKDEEIVQLKSEITLLKKNLREQEAMRRQTEEDNLHLKETSKNFRAVAREPQRETLEDRQPTFEAVQAEPKRKPSPIKGSEAGGPIQETYTGTTSTGQQQVIRETFQEPFRQEAIKTSQSFRVADERAEPRDVQSNEEKLANENAYLRNLVKNLAGSQPRDEAETTRQGRSFASRHERAGSSPSPNPDVIDRSYGSRGRDESVDQVISSILEKYNLREVPNKNELDKIFVKEQGPRSRSGERTDLQIRQYDYSKDQGVLRESAVGFLSPVMSNTDRTDFRYESQYKPK